MKTRLIIAAVAALTGCAAQKPMTPEVAQALRDKHVAPLSVAPPAFVAATPGKAMFGAFGAVAMAAAGEALIKEHRIDDPAVGMTAELARALEEKLGVAVSSPTGPVDRVSYHRFAEVHPDQDLLLDVRTVDWSIGYFPTDWGHYRVIYAVRARLVDLKTKQVLAEGVARRVPEHSADAPTYDELMASGAARLKAELKKGAAECYQQLLRDTFRL